MEMDVHRRNHERILFSENDSELDLRAGHRMASVSGRAWNYGRITPPLSRFEKALGQVTTKIQMQEIKDMFDRLVDRPVSETRPPCALHIFSQKHRQA